MLVDAIYLNKRGNTMWTNAWAYYRITSLGGLGDNIEVCLLEWPTFKDINVPGEILKAPVESFGSTGYAYAYPELCTLLKNKWNINHSDDDLIGLRFRE